MPIETFDEFAELESVIQKAVERLTQVDPTADEYATVVDHLTKLTNVRKQIADMTLKMFEATTKAEEAKRSLVLKGDELELKFKEANRPDRVSKETMAIIAANLAGILLVIGHERFNVIASKALGFIIRTR